MTEPWRDLQRAVELLDDVWDDDVNDRDPNRIMEKLALVIDEVSLARRRVRREMDKKERKKR